jgi:transposase
VAPGRQTCLRQGGRSARRRPDLADATLAVYARKLVAERDRLLSLRPTNTAGSKLKASVAVGAREKLLVFVRRRDVEPTNSGSERELRPSVIFRNYAELGSGKTSLSC